MGRWSLNHHPFSVTQSSIYTSAALRFKMPSKEFKTSRTEKEAADKDVMIKHDVMFDLFKERQSLNKQTFSNAIDVYLKREGEVSNRFFILSVI